MTIVDPLRTVAEPVSEATISLRVNGDEVRTSVNVRRLLSDLLRDELGLTGTHIGCEQGTCGACTVVVDGQAARSCTMLAVQAHGRDVVTVEGLADDPAATSMRASFTAHHALQCGFCTPGILCTVAAAEPSEWPDAPAVRELLAGNICRCTGYQHIVDAITAEWHDGDTDSNAPTTPSPTTPSPTTPSPTTPSPTTCSPTAPSPTDLTSQE